MKKPVKIFIFLAILILGTNLLLKMESNTNTPSDLDEHQVSLKNTADENEIELHKEIPVPENISNLQNDMEKSKVEMDYGSNNVILDDMRVREFVNNSLGTSEGDINKYQEAGFDSSGILKAAHLSKLKGLSADEIIKLKTNPPSGWGRILIQQGLKPLHFNANSRKQFKEYYQKKSKRSQ